MQAPSFKDYSISDKPADPLPMEQDPMLQQSMGPPPMMMQQNPFSMSPYGGMGLPNTPMQFGGGMAEQLLNDSEVPKEVRNRHWFIFHKDNALTFLDEERKRMKLLSFDIAKIDHLNTLNYYDYDFEVEKEWTILRNVMDTKLDRALGTKDGNSKNERTVLQSQFTENRMINENEGSNNGIREGFFRRLLKRGN